MSFIKLLKIVFKRKYLVFSVTTFFSVLSVVIMLVTPNKFTSNATIKTANDSVSSLSSIVSNAGGIASLLGGSVLSGGFTQEEDLGLAYMKSRDFLVPFVDKNNFLIPLFASKYWDKEKNYLVYDKKIYDIDSKIWTRKPSGPYSSKPAEEELVKLLRKKIIVKKNEKDGFINISFEHHSPVFAKKFLESLLENLNESLRSRDIAIIDEALMFLEDKLDESNSIEIKEALAILVQKKIEEQMLTSIRKEYFFEVLEMPKESVMKSYPSRTLICILASIFGLFLGVVISILLEIRIKNEKFILKEGG